MQQTPYKQQRRVENKTIKKIKHKENKYFAYTQENQKKSGMAILIRQIRL